MAIAAGTVVGAASAEAGVAETGTGAATEAGAVGKVTGAVTVTGTGAVGSEPEAKQTGTESVTAGDASAIACSDEAEGSEDIPGEGVKTEGAHPCMHSQAMWPG